MSIVCARIRRDSSDEHSHRVTSNVTITDIVPLSRDHSDTGDLPSGNRVASIQSITSPSAGRSLFKPNRD